MQNLLTKTVREIALEAPVTTRVFEEFKIDYCCGGRKMFLEACREANAEPEIVSEKIDLILQSGETKEADWLQTAGLTELIDHIEQKHHVFTREEIENLPPLMEKVVQVHGKAHPELSWLKDTFQTLCADLTPHLLKEEIILFPYIRELEASLSTGTQPSSPCFGTVQNPVRMMMMEHDTAGEILRTMRKISNDYALPEDACPSYKALFNRLEAFEMDLHQHIHLENNLLFPKAVELEESFNS